MGNILLTEIACNVMEYASVEDMIILRRVSRIADKSVRSIGLREERVKDLFINVVAKALPGITGEFRDFTPQDVAGIMSSGRCDIHGWWHLVSQDSIAKALKHIVSLACEATSVTPDLARSMGALFVAFTLLHRTVSFHLLMVTTDIPFDTKLILFRH
eukprot:TRINITY_DN13059_c0_g1_i1.p1 TRINITY_DN13059_c0_g1~~TRINITY_DN13059_c0_g1_i1.p1  ORF type:complete len:158 (+),score=9.64 TRINITY_DN13059_c0_g1_i1:111-584(+)